MLTHSTISSDKERISGEDHFRQKKTTMPNVLYEKVKEIGKSTGINIDQVKRH